MQIINATKIVYPELSYKITGAIFSTQNELGRFCNERQYCDKLEVHLKKLGLQYKREFVLPTSFENELKGRNRVDFLIENTVIVEVKVKRMLEKSDYYQAKRYLFALNKKLASLVNFRDKFLKPRRVLNSSATD